LRINFLVDFRNGPFYPSFRTLETDLPMNILTTNSVLQLRPLSQAQGLAATAFLSLALGFHTHVFAQSAAFTYQGVLKDVGVPANGSYDLQFSLFDAATAGTLAAGPLTNAPVAVSNGLFTVALDFGATNFSGADRWLEVGVRTNGSLSAYAVLAPRQQLSPAPYAISSARLGGLSASAFAPAAHTHAAGDIVSGTLNTARLNVGTSAGTVAAGDHLHDDRYYTKAQIDAMLAPLGARVSSLEGTTYNGLPPTPPSLSATVAAGGVALQWQYYTAPFANGFYLQRSPDGTNFSPLATLSTNSSSYLDQAVMATTTYYYRLMAYNTNGNSAPALASVTTPPPSLSATVTVVGVSLQWQWCKVPFTAGYYVQRSLDGSSFSQLASLSANSSSYLDQAVVASTTYYYQVVAYNTNGNLASTPVVSVTTPPSSVSCGGGLVMLVLDPPIVTAGEPLQLHLFTSGLAATNPAAQVQLVGPIGQTNLNFSVGSSPNELFATTPKGWPPGALAVSVVAANSNCVTAPAQVTGSAALTQLSISPSHVSPTQPTPLTITGQGTFAAGARAYIVPAGGGGGVPLQSVLYNSATNLSALAPGGLAAGVYDLVVINPDASAGSAPGAFVVLLNEPPVISDVSPQSITNLPGQTLVLAQQGVALGAQVTMDCLLPGNTRQQVTGTVGPITASSVQVTIGDASTLPSGSVGIVRVTNPDGGAAASPTISVTAVGNENSWTLMPTLNTPRRALSLAAARASTGNGWLYAIGGDNGQATSPYNMVETAPLDPFGMPGSWTAQSKTLPNTTRFAGAARLGSFVYLVGGNNGVSTMTSVSRAQILDLAPAPSAPSFSAVLDGTLNGGGIAAGYVQYRVSGLFPGNDPKNPNGESMAGPAIGVQVSSVTNLEVVLSWPAFSGATGYRVYKAVNGGAFLLLAQVSSPTYTDNGTGSSGPGGPNPSGSLGSWMAMPALATAREGAAVIAVPNPNVAGQNYLFAVGGLNNSTTYLSSYEYLVVNDDGTTGNSWTAGSGAMATARAHLGAWAARTADSGNIPAATYWLYFGPGDVSISTVSTGVEALTVNSAGSISTSFATASTLLLNSSAGYAAFVGRGKLYADGGAGGPSKSERESQLGLSVTATSNWNNSGVPLNNFRYYSGYAQSGAMFYIVGGDAGGGTGSLTGERKVK
jgi:hypothetical protein